MSLVVSQEDESGEQTTYVVSYDINDDVKDVDVALRGAVQDYLNSGSEEAEGALDYTCGLFNWDDAIAYIPSEYFIARGLTPRRENTVVLYVDRDEILCC